MRKTFERIGIAIFVLWLAVGVACMAAIAMLDDATMKAWIGPYAVWVIVLGSAYFVAPAIFSMLRRAYGSGSDARG